MTRKTISVVLATAMVLLFSGSAFSALVTIELAGTLNFSSEGGSAAEPFSVSLSYDSNTIADFISSDSASYHTGTGSISVFGETRSFGDSWIDVENNLSGEDVLRLSLTFSGIPPFGVNHLLVRWGDSSASMFDSVMLPSNGDWLDSSPVVSGYLEAEEVHGDINPNSTTNVSVPEPATLALFGLGLAGIPFVRRRRTPA